MPSDQQKKNTWSAICRGRTGALTSKWVFQEYERRDFLTFLFKRSSVCWSERGLREALETLRQGRGKEAEMQLTSRKKASGQRPPFEASTPLLSPDQIIWSQVAQRGGMSRNQAGGCFTRLSVGSLCLLFRSCRAATGPMLRPAGVRCLQLATFFSLSSFSRAPPPPPKNSQTFQSSPACAFHLHESQICASRAASANFLGAGSTGARASAFARRRVGQGEIIGHSALLAQSDW